MNERSDPAAVSRWAVKTYDSFTNFLVGLGGSADKLKSQQYAFVELQQLELETAYRGDWIARKVVDIPADDATREWRAWQADDKQIEKIEDLEDSMKVQGQVNLAMQTARLYGGSALVPGVGTDDPESPLNLETIKEGDLKYLHVLSQTEVTSGEAERDVTSPFYGQPKYYELPATQGLPQRIHPSRVVRFVGRPLPVASMTSKSVSRWGDSVLQAVDEAIKSAGLVSGGVANMVGEAKIDVVRIPGLMEMIGNADYKSRLTTKFTYAKEMKSILNMLILDKDEEWERITANFAGLPDLLKMYLLIASGACDIPAVRMLGQSPTGLSATGESDLRNYYDSIASMQKNKLGPTLEHLDQIIIRSALGKFDKNIFYKWNSLWQLDDVQRADLAKKKADVVKIDFDTGLVPQSALAKARQNQLIEDGFYPGLEAAIEEAEEEAENAIGASIEGMQRRLNELTAPDPTDPLDPDADEEDDEPVADAAPRRPVRDARGRFVKAEDAKPRTLYLRRDVVNGAAILAWARSQGFTKLMEPKDLHVTIAYSKMAIDWQKLSQAWGQDDKGIMRIAPGGPRAVERLGDQQVVVLMISSRDLTWRHCEVLEVGGSYDYDEYQPHITFAVDASGVDDVEAVVPYRGEIVLGPEIFDKITKGAFEKRLEELR